MKILGVGVDIVKNNRFKILTRKGNFILRTFSKNEINFSKKKNMKIAFFAKRFAAKESFSKSLGTGIREDLNFKDIEILNDKLGKPYYLLSKKIINLVVNKYNTKNFNMFLSISDEKDYSIAFTIIQKQ